MTSIFEFLNNKLYGEQVRQERFLNLKQNLSSIFVPTPTDMTKVWGADVDQYTGIVDFSIAKNNKMKFVIIKNVWMEL